MLKLSPKMWYLLKYGFLVLTSVGIILMVLPAFKPEKGPDWLDMVAENFSDSEINFTLSLEILREDVTDCFINFKAKDEVTYTFKTENTKNTYENASTGGLRDKHAIFTVLVSFSNILSLLHIKAAVIEPSMLYCMLLPKYQELLSKRHFNVSNFSGSNRVVTFGIMEEDVAILKQERNKDKFSILDFKVHIVEVPFTDWMRRKVPTSEFQSFSSHMFFMHKLCTIHLVVFQRRSQYFWHAALNMANDGKNLSKEKLLFIEHDGAYEKFLFASLENKILPVADFYVPSNTHYFLFEMLSSRFLECSVSSAASVVSTDQPRSHPDMSVEQFNRRTRFVLRDLKKVFHPLLMHLWIWSGTMLVNVPIQFVPMLHIRPAERGVEGRKVSACKEPLKTRERLIQLTKDPNTLLRWYRQCDIIPYTTDVDFASWASNVDDLDSIINLLHSSKYITIQQRMGFSEEALELHTDCHGLRTDIFFMYRVKNGSWCSGHSPKLGYYFRYFYPPFTLCSSELLGEKVQVPCETEDVIAAEYGSDWSKPTSSWHYENSPKNRGPNIYWGKQKMKYAYQIY